MSKTVRLVMMIDDDIDEDLRLASQHRGESRSSITRAALRGHLSRLVSQMLATTPQGEYLLKKYRRKAAV